MFVHICKCKRNSQKFESMQIIFLRLIKNIYTKFTLKHDLFIDIFNTEILFSYEK